MDLATYATVYMILILSLIIMWQNKGAQASTDQKPVPEEVWSFLLLWAVVRSGLVNLYLSLSSFFWKWVSLKYHGLQSEYCSRYLSGMMANGNSSIDFNMTPYDLFLFHTSLDAICVCYPCKLCFYSIEGMLISTHCAVEITAETLSRKLYRKGAVSCVKRVNIYKLFYNIVFCFQVIGLPTAWRTSANVALPG